MAHSISKAFRTSKSDELYTPSILVQPIIKYVSNFKNSFISKHGRQPIILCPFDTESSEFILAFKNLTTVKHGHISTGQDFFTHDYGDWDICVSNPPFSRKLDVFKKLDKTGKPWAMITNLMCINYEEIGRYFANNPGLQILSFDRRISFDGNPSSFMSGYFCRNLLPKNLIFEKLENNNAKQYFIGSKMIA